MLRATRFTLYTGCSFFIQLLQDAFVRIKDGKRQEEPGDALIIMLPVFAMAALIGILALLMRSTGKW